MPRPKVSRRQFLVVTGGGALTIAGCSGGSNAHNMGAMGAPTSAQQRPGRPRIASNDPAVAAAEQARRPGEIVKANLVAAPTDIDLAGRVVPTWAYNGGPGQPLIRAAVGQQLQVTLENRLPEDTTIHWHGLALRNDMDGVPDLTQKAVGPGSSFTYTFALANPGTYWFHPHVGLQLDRGLYAPLIVDDPADPARYDAEIVVVLDDWLDGLGTTPGDVLGQLRKHGGMGTGTAKDSATGAAMMGAFRSDLLGGDSGDVSYPVHLVNGRPPADRHTFEVPTGRVRMRIINAGSDTAYRIAVGGHPMRVTHTDGFPVEPVDVDTVLIGMGERYDVIVDVASGAWPIVALAEGKNAMASAVLRTKDASASVAPDPLVRAGELDGRLLRYADLRAAGPVALPAGEPSITVDLDLTGNMMGYSWGIADSSGPRAAVEIEQGQRVRIRFKNTSPMWHPMHLHGHTFALAEPAGGARKDTVNILPNTTVAIDFLADNPGQWMMHCHNAYHLEGGMATTVAYVSSRDL